MPDFAAVTLEPNCPICPGPRSRFADLPEHGISALSVFDLLAMHPLIAGLPAGWLHRLAAFGQPVYRFTGHRLFREDGPADRFWLVHSGTVALDLHVPGRGDVVIEKAGPARRSAGRGCWRRTAGGSSPMTSARSSSTRPASAR